jgi:hypothetical protein
MRVDPTPGLDSILTFQLAVAWAGEAGEEPRLGWWRTDLASEFGGEDLFRRLLPATWAWAVLQGAREAARRLDAERRSHDHDPDRLLSLFRLGSDLDERLDERLLELKQSGSPPAEALPGLRHVLSETWRAEAFGEWLAGHGEPAFEVTPAGRRLKGALPAAPERCARQLVAALAPLGPEYPLPHYRAGR